MAVRALVALHSHRPARPMVFTQALGEALDTLLRVASARQQALCWHTGKQKCSRA